MTTATANARLEKLRELMDRWYIAMPGDGDHRASNTEDLEPFVEGEEEIKEWAVITHGTGSSGDDVTYIYPEYETPEAAQAKAIENIGDDIFEETPHAIVNLDTGQELRPMWETVQWR
jgi:hypothetical protein